MSTSNKPILFFQNFFEKNHFNQFVKDFFTDYDNPTFFANTEDGYIEYIDRIYLDGEDSNKFRKTYFKDYLLQTILLQKTISINLIKDKIEDIINIGNSPDNYILNTKSSLIKLKSHIIISQTQYKDLILSILDEIEANVKKLNFQTELIVASLPKTKPYFKPTINTLKLRKIYRLACQYDILDIEITNENDFITIFQSGNPSLIKNQIIFKADNRKSVFFIFCMAQYFENIIPSTIAKSKSFYSKSTPNKPSKLLSEATINNALSFLKNNDLKNKFSDMEESLKHLEKQ